jgi:hypothetical protein
LNGVLERRNPSVSAAGSGLRDQRRFDLVKSAVPNGGYRVNLAAPSPFPAETSCRTKSR